MKMIMAFCLFLSLFPQSAYSNFTANNSSADSLLKQAQIVYRKQPAKGIALAKFACAFAKTNKDHTCEIKGINALAKFFLLSASYDSATVYGNRGLKTAESYHIDSLKADAWGILALVDHFLGNYKQAIEKYSNSIPFYSPTNKMGVALAHLNIGICYHQISQYGQSIRHCLLASRIFEELHDDEDLSSTYTSIAVCFVFEDNYTKAIYYNKRSLAIREKLKDDQLIAQSLNNIGFAFKKNNQPDSAITYLLKSVGRYKKEPDSSLLILPLQNLGSSYKMKGSLKIAENYISRSLGIAVKYKSEEDIARGNLDLAELYITQKKYQAALTAAKVTQKTAGKLGMPELLMSAYENEAIAYGELSQYKEALVFNGLKSKIKDSLFTVEKNRALAELEIKYQTAQKEKDIANLNYHSKLQQNIVKQQTRSINILTIGTCLLVVLFGGALYNYLLKTKANKRIKTLMQDLHHRVKNNLQILSGLFTMQIDSMSDEVTKNALLENQTRLTSMNLIHSKLYQDPNNTKIEMNYYLTKLLEDVKGAFGFANGKIVALRIDIADIHIEADRAVAIGLIVNELATNAFKYAFDGKDNCEISLSLKEQGKHKLLLQVADNGKGISEDNEGKRSGFGLRLIKLMCSQLGAKMNVSSHNGASYLFEMSAN